LSGGGFLEAAAVDRLSGELATSTWKTRACG